MSFTWKKTVSSGCVSIMAMVGGSSSVINRHHPISLCESKSNTESKCETFNSFYNTFFEINREDLCLKTPGCTFRGKGITGTCYPKKKTAKFRGARATAGGGGTQTRPAPSPSPSSKTPAASPALSSSFISPSSSGTPGAVVVMKGEKDTNKEDDSQIFIEVLMKQQFTSSVADQIVNSHQAARKVAKELVIEVLQSKGTVNQLGSLLGMCFAYPSVQAPIRSLAYFYLHTDVTMENILWQLEWQRHYFFSGDGKEWTETQLKELFIWWTTTENFRAVVYPLVLWVLRDRDIAVVPLSRMNAEYYNFYQEWFAETVEAAVVDHLKAEREKLKIAASEVIKDMLISNFKAKTAGPEEVKAEAKGGSEKDSGGADLILNTDGVASRDKEI